MTQPAPLPQRASDTSAEQPWPVRLLSSKIGDYIAKMPSVWVEGQIVQFNRRGDSHYCYLTLRDADADISLPVSIPIRAFEIAGMPMTEGARAVVHLKPTFWPKRGALQMDARAIRPVGQGELLARLEQLKQMLAAEGIFSPERKRRLPFLPHRVGLICGRNSAAERDVVENARRRWPALQFEIRQVPVQGTDAVAAVKAALLELDAMPAVDVIVITRGGGSFEDLLPFSNEALVRAVAAARTPVVSAIGHEVDAPLLDYVADVRASTPTDAAKRIVPDAAGELAGLDRARARLRGALGRRLDSERARLDTVRSRPVFASPAAMLDPHRREVENARMRAERVVAHRVHRAADEIGHLRARARSLSPQSTLDRGYAVVWHADGRIVMDREDVDPTELLRVRVARGDFGVQPVTRPAGSTARRATASKTAAPKATPIKTTPKTATSKTTTPKTTPTNATTSKTAASKTTTPRTTTRKASSRTDAAARPSTPTRSKA